jgi:hypothetical protein
MANNCRLPILLELPSCNDGAIKEALQGLQAATTTKQGDYTNVYEVLKPMLHVLIYEVNIWLAGRVVLETPLKWGSKRTI